MPTESIPTPPPPPSMPTPTTTRSKKTKRRSVTPSRKKKLSPRVTRSARKKREETPRATTITTTTTTTTTDEPSDTAQRGRRRTPARSAVELVEITEIASPIKLETVMNRNGAVGATAKADECLEQTTEVRRGRRSARTATPNKTPAPTPIATQESTQATTTTTRQTPDADSSPAVGTVGVVAPSPALRPPIAPTPQKAKTRRTTRATTATKTESNDPTPTGGGKGTTTPRSKKASSTEAKKEPMSGRGRRTTRASLAVTAEVEVAVAPPVAAATVSLNVDAPVEVRAKSRGRSREMRRDKRRRSKSKSSELPSVEHTSKSNTVVEVADTPPTTTGASQKVGNNPEPSTDSLLIDNKKESDTAAKGDSNNDKQKRDKSKSRSKSRSKSAPVVNVAKPTPVDDVSSQEVDITPKLSNDSVQIDEGNESNIVNQVDHKSQTKKRSKSRSKSPMPRSKLVAQVAEHPPTLIVAPMEVSNTSKPSSESVIMHEGKKSNTTNKADGKSDTKKRSKSKSKSPKPKSKPVVQAADGPPALIVAPPEISTTSKPSKNSSTASGEKESKTAAKEDGKSKKKKRSSSKSPKPKSKPVVEVANAPSVAACKSNASKPNPKSPPVVEVANDREAAIATSVTVDASLPTDEENQSKASAKVEGKSEAHKRKKRKRSKTKVLKLEPKPAPVTAAAPLQEINSSLPIDDGKEANVSATDGTTETHKPKRKRFKPKSNKLSSAKPILGPVEVANAIPATAVLSQEVGNTSKSRNASSPTDHGEELKTGGTGKGETKIPKSERKRAKRQARRQAESRTKSNASSSVKPSVRVEGKDKHRPQRSNIMEKEDNDGVANSKILSIVPKGNKQQLPPTSPRRQTKSKRKRSESIESSSPKISSPHSHQHPISPAPTRRNRSESTDSLTPRHHQLETTVHRFRHAKHIPKSILRLASTPYFRGEIPSPYLAVSREGGAVELVSVNEKWKCVGQVEGIRGRNVDAMAWVCGCKSDEGEENAQMQPATAIETTTVSKTAHFCPEHKRAEEIHYKRRLIGASRDGTIFEVDFKSKRHLNVIGSGGGGVFCLTSLCSCGSTGSGGQQTPLASCCGLFAAGCEDGSVRIYDAATNDVSGLELVCTLPNVGSAVLSIAWKSCGGSGCKGTGMAGSTLFAGVADGTIRKFECDAISATSISKGWRATTRMTVENHGRQTPTKVWALKVLTDDTVISGDSMGHIQFWDGRAGTLLQSFEHNSEKADVLDLAVNIDQSKVMACGVDSKVVCIKRNVAAVGGLKEWVMTTQRRPHTNDVNSLAIVYMTDANGAAGHGADSQKVTELLCSGGVDTRVFSYAADNMAKGSPKPVYKYPQVHPLRLARQSRILTVMRCDKVDFFQLGQKIDVKNGHRPIVPQDESQAYLGSITIAGIHNLVSMDITDDGKYLAVSDASSLYIFSLKFVDGKASNGNARKLIVPTKVNLPLSASAPSSSLKFVPDGSRRLICASTTGIVTVLKIEEEEEQNANHKVSVEHIFNELVSDPKMSTYNFPITEIVFSPDSSFVALGRNTMSTGSINVLSIMPAYKHWYTLPCIEAPFSCLTFLGGGSIKPSLVVGCSNSSFYVFDVKEKCLSDWSNDLGCPANLQLPKELNMQPDGPARLAFNPSSPNKFLMGGQNSFFSVDLDSPLPTRSRYFPDDHISARKSRFLSTPNNKRKKIMKDDPECLNLTICLRYSGIIFMDFLSEDELVVVEQPWLGILSSLPDGLERKRFGA